MKIKNIFALIATLISFAACTSECELQDTPVTGDLIPVTINIGSTQTKSVDLADGEGTINNAVVAIFDSKGIPTVAPMILSGNTSSTVRIPLVKSKAYAFANVSDADINELKSIGNENDFKSYVVKKQLTQVASELPKFGQKLNFTPTDGGSISINVNQLTARVETLVNVRVRKNGQDVTNTNLSFVKSSLTWSNMEFKNTTASSTNGNDGSFETIINNVIYSNVLNRAYSYSGAQPTIHLSGSVEGQMDGFNEMNASFSYTFKTSLSKDCVYLVKFMATVDISIPTKPIFTYEVLPMESISVDVPEFN